MQIVKILILGLFIFSTSFSLSAETRFVHDGTAQNAAVLEQRFSSLGSRNSGTAEEWKLRGQREFRRGEFNRAIKSFSVSLAKDKNDASTWLKLAQSYLGSRSKSSNERYRFSRNAASAAYFAYQRAKDTEGDTTTGSLLVLARAFKRMSLWRPSLDTYKLYLARNDEDNNARMEYNRLNKSHGFRLLDYRVDSEARVPRICLQFSEDLVAASSNYDRFVKVNGVVPPSLNRESRQICIEDLKHGERYHIQVRDGLPSAIDEKILKPFEITTYIRDRKPAVRFNGNKFILPRTGQNGIPVVSVNTDKVAISIFKIGDRNLLNTIIDGNFRQQLSRYQAEKIENNKGSKIWSGELKVKIDRNKEVSTAFPVNQISDVLDPGLYVMQANAGTGTEQEWQPRATQWFIVSDIGLTTFSGTSGIFVFARSISETQPLSGLKLRLLARNNEVLAETTTDNRGYAGFPKGLTRGQGGLTPTLVIAESKSGDYAFLDLTRSNFDLTDRGVGGRKNPGPLDAYLHSERGVYRPGEQVRIVALLRDETGVAVENLPLILKVKRPDGKEHQTVTLADRGFGGRALTLPLHTMAMTGTWRISAHATPKSKPIGQLSFLVEDFVPQKLELKLSSKSDSVSQASPARISMAGRYLYGAPASNLGLQGDVTISTSRKKMTNWPGYHFGLESETFTPVRRPISNLQRTDSSGQSAFDLQIPNLPKSTVPLTAKVSIRLMEPGGRAVERLLSLPVMTSQEFIGIKPQFKENFVSEGATAGFAIVALGGDRKPAAAQEFEWQVVKLHRRYQWYSQNGRWRYEPITYSEALANGSGKTGADGTAELSMPVKWGRYRLEVTGKNPGSPSSSFTFTAGWYGDETEETPDVIDLSTDKSAYAPGETMNVSLQTQEKGRALVAIIGNTLLEFRDIDVDPDSSDLQFEVQPHWGNNFYVAAMFHRPLDAQIGRMPKRSIGLKWIKVSQPASSISVNLETPDKVRPNSTLSIPVKITGLEKGKKALVTVSAVDVGILNLTGHKSPDPRNYFYGQRHLSLELRDIYGQLINGMQATTGQIRFGGDGGLHGMGNKAPEHEPVSLFSDIVEVDENGLAEVKFDIPEFDGTLRLAAMAWNGTQLGQASKELIVRDPVVFTANLPRFLTALDQPIIQVSVHNVTAKAGDYSLVTEFDGLNATSSNSDAQTFALKPGEKKTFRIGVKSSVLGKTSMKFQVRGPDNFQLERSYALEVMPVQPNLSRNYVLKIPANKGKLTVDSALIDDFIPDTVNITMNIGGRNDIDVPGLLHSLSVYPHGCAEQTTSKAFPLLYLSSLPNAFKFIKPETLKTIINTSIERLQSMQTGGGGFGLWGPSNENIWLTAYVTDFLTRAQAKGYKVQQDIVRLSLDRLKNYVNFNSDVENNGEAIAYALFILARQSKAGIGDLRFYVDAELDKFSTPLARAQLGAALALYGDKPRSEQAFQSAYSLWQQRSGRNNDQREDFGSSTRDLAGLITLVSENSQSDSQTATLDRLVGHLDTTGSATNTQEQAWLITAAGSLANRTSDLRFAVDGTLHDKPFGDTLTPVSGLNRSVVNHGKNPLNARITVTGASNSPALPLAKGFRIRRELFTLDGEKVTSDKVKQNDRLIVVITTDEIEPKKGRYILVDRIPAGFEIENPRLVDSASLGAYSWLPANSPTEHREFRDDRFVAAFDTSRLRHSKTARTLSVAYMVRAVTPGRYTYPVTSIEDMYRVERQARTGTGTMTIERFGN